VKVDRSPATQARSVATRERIIDAAEGIIVRDGIAACNTNAIAREAGINVGTLYHHFNDKLDILFEIDHRVAQRFITALEGRVAEFQRDAVMRWVYDTLVAIEAADRHHIDTGALRRGLNSIPDIARVDSRRDGAIAAMIASLATANDTHVGVSSHGVLALLFQWRERNDEERSDDERQRFSVVISRLLSHSAS
jgi:AcrR family transcriptional regulator